MARKLKFATVCVNIAAKSWSKALVFVPGPHYKESRRDRRYSEQTFGLSIVLTALLALVIGFALGLLTSKSCCQEPKQQVNEIYDKTLNFTK